jgi:hypothetical protein
MLKLSRFCFILIPPKFAETNAIGPARNPCIDFHKFIAISPFSILSTYTKPADAKSTGYFPNLAGFAVFWVSRVRSVSASPR